MCLTGENDVDVCLRGEDDVHVCLRGEEGDAVAGGEDDDNDVRLRGEVGVDVCLREEEGDAVAEGEEGCVVCMYFFGAGEEGEEVLRSVDDFLMAGDEDWK